MSFKALTTVLHRSRAKGNSLVAGLILADLYDDEKGYAWPSVDYLARLMRCSTRTAQEGVRALERLGEWRVEVGAGPNGTNRHVILWQNFGPDVVRRGCKSCTPQNLRGAESRRESAPNPLRPLSTSLRVQNLHPSEGQVFKESTPHEEGLKGEALIEAWEKLKQSNDA